MHSFTHSHKLTLVVRWDPSEAPKLARPYWFSGTVNTQGDREAFLHGVTMDFKVDRWTPMPERLDPLITAMSADVQAAVMDGSRPAEGRKDHFPCITVSELRPETREELLSVVRAKIEAVQGELLAEA